MPRLPASLSPRRTAGLPNLAREMDLHPDGVQVATAHYDKHVRITKLAAG